LFVGLRVQASARSPPVRTLIAIEVGFADLVGGAARVVVTNRWVRQSMEIKHKAEFDRISNLAL
jgi:hypothetical protein